MLWNLFITFFKIGVMTFGGGYAMLPILQREIADNKKWSSDNELMDYFAIGQCTPGMIAVNVATFIGYKKQGFIGGLSATLGIIAPSILIITLLSFGLSQWETHPLLTHALGGVRICVTVLVLDVIIKLGKQSITDGATIFIFLLILALTFFTSLSPVSAVLIAGALGYFFTIQKKGASFL